MATLPTLPTHPSYILLRDLLLDETRNLDQLTTQAQETQHISTLFVACVDPDTAVEDVRSLYRKGAVHSSECTGICCTGSKVDLVQAVGGFTVDPTEEETQRKKEDLQREAQGIQARSTDKLSWLSSLSVQKTQMEAEAQAQAQAHAQAQAQAQAQAPTSL
jgi:hypothetical protein